MSVLMKPMQKSAGIGAVCTLIALARDERRPPTQKKPLNQPYGIVSHRTEVCRGEQRGSETIPLLRKMPAMEEYPNIPTIPSGRSDLSESAPPNLMPATWRSLCHWEQQGHL
jgi:hypothetical protein